MNVERSRPGGPLNNNLLIAGVFAAFGLAWFGAFRVPEELPTRVFSHTTKPMVVDDIYPSMFGPTEDRYDIKLLGGVPELVWVTGYSAKMIDANGARQSQEFMCHDTLSFHDVALHQKLFDPLQGRQRRLFTLSQGQDKAEFPDGFGIPMSASENLMLQSQLLNLREEGIGATVSHKIETNYIADKDLKSPMKALTMIDAGIRLDILDPQAEAPHNDPMGCAPNAGGQPTFTFDGRPMTAHWMVKPGFERRESALGKIFPIDTTAHYISVHMHAYGKSLELYDMTAGQTVYKSVCTATEDGCGLAATTEYSSSEGLRVYRDHDYKIISEYDNTSKEDQTAMAFVFVYVHNPHFEKPQAEEIRMATTGSEDLCSPEGR